MQNAIDLLSKFIAVNFILFGVGCAFHILFGLFQGTIVLNPGIFYLWIGYSLFKNESKGLQEAQGATRISILILVFVVFYFWHASEIILNGMIIGDSTRYWTLALLLFILVQSIIQYVILSKKYNSLTHIEHHFICD